METIILKDSPAGMPPCAATIGFFDGVHRGHRYLIRQVIAAARERGLASAVVTFDRHPRRVLDSAYRPLMLSTFAEKVQLLAKTGVDYCVVLPFSRQMAALSARSFMDGILRSRLGVRTLVTGYDNRFGAGRAEGFDDYVLYGREMDMEVRRAEPFVLNGVSVSSSVIRSFLAEGEVEMAALCLGYHYMLAGTVVTGEQVGRGIGFPTANLQPDDADKLIPAPGAYAVRATLPDGNVLPAMMNIGHRPTFDGHRTTLETHVLDFSGDLYGSQMGISFVARLRAERKFRSPAELAAQLRLDEEETRRRVGN